MSAAHTHIWQNMPVGSLQNAAYSLLVRSNNCEIFLIQLTDFRLFAANAPEGHGEVVQEMISNDAFRTGQAVAALLIAPDPLALARSWAAEFNCETPGGRIRLDAVEPTI